LGYGALLSVLMGVFDYTGGKLTGYEKDPTVDEVDRKEFLRKNRRRPIWETIMELGEGRGLYPTIGFKKNSWTDIGRYIWPWLSREAAGADQAELRNRCWRGPIKVQRCGASTDMNRRVGREQILVKIQLSRYVQ
jgi:hypothetical protein